MWSNWAHDCVGATGVLSVAAITGGLDVPSARFRVRQYSCALLSHGVRVTELLSRTKQYPPEQRWKRLPWGALRIVEMVGVAIRSHRYDVTLLQREMVSTLTTLERCTGRPRVLDVDDAIHLYHNGDTAKALAAHCDRIICGNNYLAEIYRQWNSDVIVLPTGIDTQRYCPTAIMANHNDVVLGWIGTSSNLRYLQQIAPALAAVLKKHSNAILRVICDKAPNLPAIELSRVHYVPWSAEAEVAAIQSFSIGLMPLEDSPWSRGKCSFKMLQYMACGLPVVVSPVGMNSDVLKLGEIGYGATTLNDWVESLLHLIECDASRRRMGGNGRKIAESEFSVVSLAPLFAGYLRGM